MHHPFDLGPHHMVLIRLATPWAGLADTEAVIATFLFCSWHSLPHGTPDGQTSLMSSRAIQTGWGVKGSRQGYSHPASVSARPISPLGLKMN